MMNSSIESSLYSKNAEFVPLDQIAESIAKVESLKILPHLASKGIFDEEHRFAVARIVAKSNPERLAQTINNYYIRDERLRIILARIVGRLDGHALSFSIQNFNIKNQKVLKKLVLLSAANNPEKTAEYIEEYQLSSESSRIKVAKFIAKRSGESISTYMPRFHITKEVARIAIAKLSAEQDGEETSEFIVNYEITSQAALKEVAKIAIRQNPIGTANEITEYQINKLSDRLELFLYTFHRKPLTEYSSVALRFFENLKEDLAVFPILALLTNQPLSDEEKQKIVKDTICSISLSPLPSTLIKLIESSFSADLILVRNQIAQLWAILLLDCMHANIPKESLADGIELLNALFNLRAPLLRCSLERPFVKLLKDCKQLICYNRFSIHEKTTWIYLPAMLLAKFFALKWDPMSKEISLVETRALKIFQDKYFKDKLRLPSLLHFLETLYSTEKLSDKEKCDLLEVLVFNSDEVTPSRVFNRLQHISHLITFGEVSRLKSIKKACQLQRAVEQTFKMSLGLGSIKNFRKKFKASFGLFRQPLAVLTYAACLKKLEPDEQPEHLDLLKSYAISVLENNFKTLRYLPTGNPHLELLHKRSGLIDKWKQGAEFQILELLKSKKKESYSRYRLLDTDDPCDLLLIGTEVSSCQRIDGDPESNRCLLAYLLDGKNRAMVIKDALGKIVGRCILRLLWDNFMGEPVLFQEKIYPDKLDEELAEALNLACIERSKQLQVSLYAMHTGASSLEEESIESFGSQIPYEYIDALESQQEKGRFLILNAKQVHSHIYSDEDEIVYF